MATETPNTTKPTCPVRAFCQNCEHSNQLSWAEVSCIADYMNWAEHFEQANEEGRAGEFFALDRKVAKEYFPVYVRERLSFERRRMFGVPAFKVLTPDYEVRIDTVCDEHQPQMTIHSRTRHIMPETYEGEVKELAEYAAKRLGRTGLSRLVLNETPDAVASALTKSDDFFHNLFYPVTSRVGRFIDECFD